EEAIHLGCRRQPARVPAIDEREGRELEQRYERKRHHPIDDEPWRQPSGINETATAADEDVEEERAAQQHGGGRAFRAIHATVTPPTSRLSRVLIHVSAGGLMVPRQPLFIAAASTLLLLALLGAHPAADDVGMTTANWGTVASAVFGTSQSGEYSGAELFAGPNQFDNDYFHGVLPNGRIVRPAGVSAQIGMNPLGARLTPDGRFLVTTNDDERGGGLASLKNGTNRGGYSLSVLD